MSAREREWLFTSTATCSCMLSRSLMTCIANTPCLFFPRPTYPSLGQSPPVWIPGWVSALHSIHSPPLYVLTLLSARRPVYDHFTIYALCPSSTISIYRCIA